MLIAVKKGEGDGWIPDPMGGSVEKFWAACSQNELEATVTSAGFRQIEGRTRLPLPTEIAIDRIYVEAECIKPASRVGEPSSG